MADLEVHDFQNPDSLIYQHLKKREEMLAKIQKELFRQEYEPRLSRWDLIDLED